MTADELLLDDFSRGDFVSTVGTTWQGFSDRVMGGVSIEWVTRLEIHGQGCQRLTGDVRLDNSGGFIQMALDLASNGGTLDASRYRGLCLKVFGNGETYGVHLRTPDCTRSWQSYRATFVAEHQWRTLELPFSQFEPYRLTKPLDIRHLRRLGLVAIGRAFEADLAVARIAFYGSEALRD